MDEKSKLPKFTGSRRPLTGNRQILPFDRIRPGCGTNSLVQQNCSNGGDGSRGGLFLSRDMSKMMGSRKREGSPEVTKPNASAQYKLRRSRSACDLRDTRELKRAKLTLAPIACKSIRLPATVTKGGTQGTGCTAKPPRKDVKPSTTIRPVPIKAAVKQIPSQASTKSCTSTSTANAAKPVTRKVPSYDFKTRFHNLLEKHKTLQTKYETNLENLQSMEDLPEQLEESQAQLYSTKEELKHAKNEIECLQRQTRCQSEKIDSLTGSLENTTKELTKLKQDYEKISNEHNQLSIENVELHEKNKELVKKNDAFTEIVDVCREQVFRSNMERKELHNTVMDLRGNIRVFCRVRPPLQCEENKALCSVSFLDESTLEIDNCGGGTTNGKGRTGTHTFSFDHVFHQRSTQEDIFQMVSPLIQSALDGYNICIFAYGQTGSGKTFTMDGTAENIGVIPRTVDLLFNAVEQYKRFGWEYEIKATFLEIYNEVLYDLLSNEQKDMEIRMCKDNKNNIYVSNLTQATVETEEELRNLMTIAKMYRATATTINNERSSRSHAVTKIEVIGKHREKGEVCVGSINLVDLAGSESPKTSTRMNETKNINRSLSELTNVILALLQKQDHIPYRNSKLTHLLMPSLGGNSKTLMFINVAPLQDCFVESVKSLRFAASVNSCKMAKAKRNKVLNTSGSAL